MRMEAGECSRARQAGADEGAIDQRERGNCYPGALGRDDAGNADHHASDSEFVGSVRRRRR